MKKLAKSISFIIIACMIITAIPMTGADVVSAATKATVSTTQKVKVTESGLRMRESYSTDSKIKGKTTKGTTYQLKAKTKDGEWGQLKSNSYWICLDYTIVIKDTVTSTDKVKITANSVNLRERYTTNSEIKGKVKKGETYLLKAKTKDGVWGQLKTNGYWISLNYTEVVKEPVDSNIVASTDKVKVTSTGLRMRASYSTSSDIKGTVTKGTTYQLKAKTKDGKWGQLASNGYWIALQYTEVVNATTSGSTSSGSSTTSNIVSTTEKVIVKESGLRMRASYSTSSDIKGKTTLNEVYELKAKTKDGKWGQLKTNGYWIYLEYTEPFTGDVADSDDSDEIIKSSSYVIVVESGLRIRASNSTSSKIVGKTALGDVFELKKKTSNGKWGQIKESGYWIYLQGYTMPVADVSKISKKNTNIDTSNVVSTKEKVKIKASNLNMRVGPGTNYKVVGTANKGVCYQLRAKTKDGEWGQLDNNHYWIYLKGYTTTVKKLTYLDASTQINNGKAASIGYTGEDIVNYAMMFIGNPYVFSQENLVTGTDCSGYTMSVYQHFGIKLPHYSGSQAKVGREVPYSEAKPGDIIWYPGHVALYIGNGKIIHASTPATGIKISNAQYRSIGSVRRIIE